jgi:hypothetical protein
MREYTRKYVDLSTSFQSTQAHQYVSVEVENWLNKTELIVLCGTMRTIHVDIVILTQLVALNFSSQNLSEIL